MRRAGGMNLGSKYFCDRTNLEFNQTYYIYVNELAKSVKQGRESPQFKFFWAGHISNLVKSIPFPSHTTAFSRVKYKVERLVQVKLWAYVH